MEQEIRNEFDRQYPDTDINKFTFGEYGQTDIGIIYWHLNDIWLLVFAGSMLKLNKPLIQFNRVAGENLELLKIDLGILKLANNTGTDRIIYIRHHGVYLLKQFFSMYPNEDRTKFKFTDKVNVDNAFIGLVIDGKSYQPTDNILKSFTDDLNPETRARLYRDLGY